MAKLNICGRDNVPTQPSFFIPNRLDEKTLTELDLLLGGADKLAFLMEDVLTPQKGMLSYIKSKGRRCLSFNFRKANGRELREELVKLMAEGYHILYVPGRPNSVMGSISDVPMPFMMQLAALHIAPVPVFVGFYKDSIYRAFATDSAYDIARIDICPKLAPGPMTGDRLLEAWFDSSAEGYEKSPLLQRSVTSLLVEGMRRNAKVQLVDGLDESSLPYYKVLGVSMALARKLKSMVKEPRLGIILPPGKGGAIANYACLLAGIVPVNINYTSSESSFASIVKQSGIKHFITARAFMVKLPQFPWPDNDSIIHLDKTLKGLGMSKIAAWVSFARFAPMALVRSVFNLDERKGNDEVALLFTSGSSGEPKGVSFTHRMLVANMSQVLSRIYLPEGSAFLCSLPIFHSFGLTVTTIIPPVYGFSMVTYPSPLESKRLNELVEKYQCRVVTTTPTFARGMLRRAAADTFRSIKYFLVGAEKLQKDMADEFYDRCGIRLFEGYGLTECSPVASVNFDPTGPTEEQPYFVPGHQLGTVGQVLPGMAVRITDPDDDDKPLPLSTQGMVWLRGANVFSGYVGQEDSKGKIFKDGWFKTGDLGKVDLNGMLTLGGRRSRFSKIGGEMVPHEVVEQAIEEFVVAYNELTEDQSRAIAIVGVPDKQKGEAMVLLSSVHHAQLAQVLDSIRNHLVSMGLPRLWVPREIIPVELIPMLPTGKMDLKGCQCLAFESLGLPLQA